MALGRPSALSKLVLHGRLGGHTVTRSTQLRVRLQHCCSQGEHEQHKHPYAVHIRAVTGLEEKSCSSRGTLAARSAREKDQAESECTVHHRHTAWP